MLPIALTIAGSDPSGGAGLQADLKTFHQQGVYGTSVVTLLTVQNTQRVDQVGVVAPEFVLAQLDSLLDDVPPAAAKTGALGSASVISAIAGRARHFDFPLVVDPIMVSTHGRRLMEPDAVEVFKNELLPSALLVTPNLDEASVLAEMTVDDLPSMQAAAERIGRLGPQHVLVKGGHLAGKAVDLLWSDGVVEHFPAQRVSSKHTHGTGCVLSAAITARLAFGDPVVEAVRVAKQFVTRAIRSSPQLGHGNGPLNFHATADDCAIGDRKTRR